MLNKRCLERARKVDTNQRDSSATGVPGMTPRNSRGLNDRSGTRLLCVSSPCHRGAVTSLQRSSEPDRALPFILCELYDYRCLLLRN